MPFCEVGGGVVAPPRCRRPCWISWRLLVDWVAQLSELRALLGSLGQAAPRSSSSELRSRYQGQTEPTASAAHVGFDEEQQARDGARIAKPRD